MDFVLSCSDYQRDMRITITTEDGGYFSLQVSHELTLGDLKALVEIETAGMANPDTMLLIHNMAPMTDPDKSLASYDVQQGDIIMVAVKSGDANISNPATRSQAGSSGARGNPLPVMDWSSVQLPGSSTSGGWSLPQCYNCYYSIMLFSYSAVL